MRGILVIDKPKGLTSHDVVQAVRRILGGATVGHTGTLDPAATGVLVVMVGGATKIAPFLKDEVKEYEVTMVFGLETDTWDLEGKIVSKRACRVTADDVAGLIPSFRGNVEQRPPPVSAVKVGGEPLYRRTRRGEDVRPPVRRVTFHRLELDGFVPGDFPEARLLVTCSAGTYIRSLAMDMGKKLGCAGVVKELVRTRAGRFTLGQGLNLEDVDVLARESRLSLALVSMSDALGHMPAVKVSAIGQEEVLSGRGLTRGMLADTPGPIEPESVFRVLDEGGELLAVARANESYKAEETSLDEPIAALLRVFPVNGPIA